MEINHLLHLEQYFKQTSEPTTKRSSHNQPQDSESLLHFLRHNDIVLDKIINNKSHICIAEDFGSVNGLGLVWFLHQKLKSAGSMFANSHIGKIDHYCVYCNFLLSGRVADFHSIDGHNQILYQGNLLNYVGVAVVEQKVGLVC